MSGLALEIYNDGVEAGIEQGLAQGIKAFAELVRDGKIDVSYVIKKLGITKDQFDEYLKQ